MILRFEDAHLVHEMAGPAWHAGDR